MRQRKKIEDVKISLDIKKIILISVLIFALFIIDFCLPQIYSWYKSLQPVTKIVYFNIPMEFRADLRLAKNIEVYPNEEIIKDVFWNKNLNRITIAILNTTNETHYIGVEAYEITFKLVSFYTLNGLSVEVKGKEVSDILELKGNSTNPVIYIIPPAIANETLVRLENYTVFISGRSLRELDLATTKFIMTVLGIRI
ncbi:MAG: hypothetical protein QXI09_00440 [Candidatus Aenigmatarchaeota archaeon]